MISCCAKASAVWGRTGEGQGGLDPYPWPIFPALPFSGPLFFLIFFYGYPCPKFRFLAPTPVHLTPAPAHFSSKDPHPPGPHPPCPPPQLCIMNWTLLSTPIDLVFHVLPGRWTITILLFNSLWPSDTRWHQISWTTLIQVMAPSHYLNHIDLSLIGSTSINLQAVSQELWIPIFKMSLKIILFKLLPHLTWANELICCWI